MVRCGSPLPAARLAASCEDVVLPAASTGWNDSFAGLSSMAMSFAVPGRVVHDEWHLKHSWYSVTAVALPGGTKVYVGAVPASPFVTETRLAPISALVDVTACGLWQSVHSEWRLVAPKAALTPPSAVAWRPLMLATGCAAVFVSSAAMLAAPGPDASWHDRHSASSRKYSRLGTRPCASRAPWGAWQLRHLPSSPAGRAAGVGPGQRMAADVAWMPDAYAACPAYTDALPAAAWHVKHSVLSLGPNSTGDINTGVCRTG